MMRDIGENQQQKLEHDLNSLVGFNGSLDQTFKDLRIKNQDLLDLQNQLKNQLLPRESMPLQTTSHSEDLTIPKFILILLKDRKFRKFKKILKGLEDRVAASISPVNSPKNQTLQILLTGPSDDAQMIPGDEPMHHDNIGNQEPLALSLELKEEEKDQVEDQIHSITKNKEEPNLIVVSKEAINDEFEA